MFSLVASRWLGFGLLVGALVACTERGPGAPEPVTSDEPPRAYGPPPPKQALSEPASRPPKRETIEPGKVVPAFRLSTVDGQAVDSADLVGKKPFVVLFFASWCGVCEEKLPQVQQALAEDGGDLLVLGAALDEPESWPKVAPYLERHGLSLSLVRAQEHLGFARAYDPFGSVPVVMVINRKGIIVELQRGLREGDEARLRAALRLVQQT